MKIKTICIIREILKNECNKACDVYNLLRDNLNDKYQTDGIDSKVINNTEKELLKDLKAKYSDLSDALRDLEDHQWH